MSRLLVQNLRSPLAGPFDLALAAGECLAITGASGAGKSLFLRMIADLDPGEGEVALDGRSRASFGAPAWRRQVMYVAAEPGWWAERVADHFAAPRLPAARDLARRLGLEPELVDAPVLRLSTGERQRLALMRALVLDPPVLLLDEPTGALDEPTTLLVETVLAERIALGAAVIAVTHSPAQASRLAGRRLTMAERQLHPTDDTSPAARERSRREAARVGAAPAPLTPPSPPASAGGEGEARRP